MTTKSKTTTAKAARSAAEQRKLLTAIRRHRAAGLGWWGVAAKLNEAGFTAARGGQWYGPTVRQLALREGITAKGEAQPAKATAKRTTRKAAK
jgi:hypothetical protein